MRHIISNLNYELRRKLTLITRKRITRKWVRRIPKLRGERNSTIREIRALRSRVSAPTSTKRRTWC